MSKVHADNRMETCRECHTGKKDLAVAPAGYASFQPHGHGNDFSRYPQIWMASKLMIGLLVGTFSFFWPHAALWLYREYKERQQCRPRHHLVHLGQEHFAPGLLALASVLGIGEGQLRHRSSRLHQEDVLSTMKDDLFRPSLGQWASRHQSGSAAIGGQARWTTLRSIARQRQAFREI